MGVLIVGDVHGCYHTLKALVSEYWQPEQDQLVLIGDLINKGPHSAKALKYALKLKRLHPKQVVLIRGNHEQWFLEHFKHQSKSKTYLQFSRDLESVGLDPKEVHRLLRQWPLHWENGELFVSHAGLSDAAFDPFDPNDLNGLLKNRKNLKHLNKVQVIGHNIISEGKPKFRPQENAWYIDTGAWFQSHLSALYFKEGSNQPKVYQKPRHEKDGPPVLGDKAL